ncbi:MAG: translation initiation factor [Planctomycetes bacterium]|nr:translation initiation factor [Planctomycetota bacterium]
MGRLFAGTEFYQPPKCERCGKLEHECQCPPAPTPRIPPEKQTAKLAVEKRKKGKVVTIVRGLPARGNNLPLLLSMLKTACGAGGAIKEDALEIQGKHVERIREALVELGYRVKG